ncbi:MAG: hypothetical protein FWH15_09520 [Betaproteobacteria bacterium]|nr:hypothetical protein [Betaproteobacteria bacterium]
MRQCSSIRAKENVWYQYVVQIVIAIVSAIVAAALAPKPKVPKPASLEDFDVPQHVEGSAQIWVFGDCWIPDWFVLGIGNFRTSPIRTKSGK